MKKFILFLNKENDILNSQNSSSYINKFDKEQFVNISFISFIHFWFELVCICSW